MDHHSTLPQGNFVDGKHKQGTMEDGGKHGTLKEAQTAHWQDREQ